MFASYLEKVPYTFEIAKCFTLKVILECAVSTLKDAANTVELKIRTASQ